MSLSVSIVKRKLVSGENAGKAFYFGQVKAGELVSFDRLCEKISEYCAATKGDVMLALNAMLLVTKDHLEDGRTVQLGNLGTIRMTAGSRGAESAEVFNVSYMKKARIVFNPGKVLRKLLTQVTFDRTASKTVVVTCDKIHVA